MKKKILLFASLMLAGGVAMAQVPRQSTDVLLQGFYWESQNVTGWTQLTNEAATIGKSFTGIWLPPSAAAEGDNTVGGTNVGYHPRIWNNQNSTWGTADNLKTLINTLHNNNVKVIADIVVNHRGGYTSWLDFAPDNFGTYGSYQLTAADVCSTDEVNTDPNAGSYYGKATGAADTGENWAGARDLDMTSTNVQNDIKAYLNWLKGEFGYDGFRYDLVKGYKGSYVGLFNDATSPWLSVGEYWDGGYDAVNNWLKATNYKSMAFDFPAKYAIFNNGLAKGNFSNMSWTDLTINKSRPAGLIHHGSTRPYAVTFVDNHDTYRDDSKFTGVVDQAYAVLMASAGIPMVFYPHWKSAQSLIEKQIACRKVTGIHSETDVDVTQKGTYYESYSYGTAGTLICRVGASAPTTVPEGYFLAAQGNSWWYYLPLTLQDTLTGVGHIATVQPVVKDGAIYDLSGRHANDATKGVVIQNGQKVLR